MLVPVEWLRDYTDIKTDITDFCDKMILSGSNLETVKYYGEEIEKVVVGKILSVEKHADSDRLLITRVDVGNAAPIQIVTGAPNVFVGAFVPVALPGSVLPGGVVIKSGKLRGEESDGMLCSAAELGFDDKVVPVSHKDGIWILEGEHKPGADFLTAFQLRDAVIDFEITPNRPDCLSMIGMAREAAAILEEPLRCPDTKISREHGRADDFISVEIRRTDLCRRYIARIVTDVKIEASPWWMQRRLMLAGMRPINNIVDITNYVMLEYGHPIHAFDIRMIEGEKIIVDTAAEGQKFMTLDGTERTLSENMLMINDGVKAVAVAGVMGGLNSEIKGDTKTILVEAANFDSDSVRATSRKLGLRTEASSRYEKGIDPNLSEEAANRVCALIEQLGAGHVVKGMVDAYPEKVRAKAVTVRVDRVNQILGTTLTRREMERMLERLKIQTMGLGNLIEALPPTIRMDLKEEIDFVEEIARIYGYDRLAVTLPKGDSQSDMPPVRRLADRTRQLMTAMGYDEIQTYSFVSPGGADLLQVPENAGERRFVRLINPLGEENSVMRTMLLPGLLEVLARNYARNAAAVRVFEIGNTFFHTAEDRLPDEILSLTAGSYGADSGFHALKGVLETLLAQLGITDAVYEAATDIAAWHPGRCARIFIGGVPVGYLGEVHPDVTERLGIDVRCCALEVSFDVLAANADTMSYYTPLPKYPAVQRDIALLVKEAVSAGELEAAVRSTGSSILESVRLFDVYRGKQVKEGYKSIAFNLVYRSPERTLTDEEVAADHERILNALKERTGAVLRDL